MTAQTCETCRFCVGRFNPISDAKLHCRRYPPQILGGEYGQSADFPRVYNQEWCGEWAARPQQPEDEA